jgi:ligand-binding SRPBCC domain-containing protein
MEQVTVVERSSRIPRPAADVWGRVTTPEGIRHELLPILSMTMPPGLRRRTLEDAPEVLGRPLGKAWLLLFGMIPVDFDDMTLVAFEPGRSFHEVSRMALLPRWEHERSVTPDGDGACIVHDRLTFEPRLARLPGVRRLVAAVVGALFSHRHRRLARWAAP